MNKRELISMLVVLSGFCLAQEQNSAAAIMEELRSSSPASVDEPVQVASAKLAQNKPGEEKEDVQSLIDEAIDLYACGKTGEAGNLLQRAAASHPDNQLVRYFLEKTNGRVRRAAEETALEAVGRSWDGMRLQDYRLSEKVTGQLKLSDADQAVDVEHLFAQVDFPERAYAIYRPQLSKIIVLNTPENLAKIERIMTVLSEPAEISDGQIEIEARFVEFAEGALEELGFEWSDPADGNAQSLRGDWAVQDGESLFADGLRDSGDVFEQPQALGSGEVRADGRWTAMRLRDRFSTAPGTVRLTGDIGDDVDVLIRALDQTSGADVLSAPRIVTRSGEKALIQVGEMHHFPTVFETGANEGTIVHVQYEEFAEQLMGVELAVTPKLVEGDLIDMRLNPKITQLLGWRRYQIAPADSAYTFYQYRVGMSYKHDPIIARLPIVRNREVKTKLTIKDGSTIGMGGLIHEKSEDFVDRVPVLGSIPLLGRLFRSEGERTVRRNLMIFVTAKQIGPDGRTSLVSVD